MLKPLAFLLAFGLIASSAFALSETEYNRLLKTSPEFREADANLNATWKNYSKTIKKSDKPALVRMQKEWIKSGRDIDAREYMDMGYTRDCAYAKATRRWIKELDVFAYNSSLPPDRLGAAKTEGAFWDEDDSDIPPHCRAR